jgi:hypothetical protein
MPDDEAIERKHKLLAAETYEYFWNVCPELTAQWKQAMLTLPPSVLRDLAVEIQHLEAATNAANQQLNAAAHPGAVGGGEPVEGLLGSRPRFYGKSQGSRRHDDATARRAVEDLVAEQPSNEATPAVMHRDSRSFEVINRRDCCFLWTNIEPTLCKDSRLEV